jgi:hypothetical protein
MRTPTIAAESLVIGSRGHGVIISALLGSTGLRLPHREHQ